MPDPDQQLIHLLDSLEQGLKDLGLWSSQPPPDDLHLSATPFCFDRIQFQEWLQWVFLPQIRQLIQMHMPLPGQSSIAPMAEVALKEQPAGAASMVKILVEIDSCLTQGDAVPH